MRYKRRKTGVERKRRGSWITDDSHTKRLEKCLVELPDIFASWYISNQSNDYTFTSKNINVDVIKEVCTLSINVKAKVSKLLNLSN